MALEKIGKYDVELSAVQVPDSSNWVPSMAIYAESANPAHRNAIFPLQRVALDCVYSSEQAALDAAREVARKMIA
jgi:hypothetical protein